MSIDHVTEALERLTEQFKDKPNFVAFATALIAPVQDIEDAMQQLLLERDIETAIGAQLDMLGEIVGQARGGLGDDEYRRYVRARIKANRSRGTVEDLLQVARLVLGDADAALTLRSWGIASYDLTIADQVITDAVATILLAFLKDATSVGVRPILNYSPTNPDENLIFDSSTPAQFWDAGTWASSSA